MKTDETREPRSTKRATEPSGSSVAGGGADPTPARGAGQDPDARRNRHADGATSDIELRAFELFLESGGEHGRDLEHWLKAEGELRRGETPRD